MVRCLDRGAVRRPPTPTIDYLTHSTYDRIACADLPTSQNSGAQQGYHTAPPFRTGSRPTTFRDIALLPRRIQFEKGTKTPMIQRSLSRGFSASAEPIPPLVALIIFDKQEQDCTRDPSARSLSCPDGRWPLSVPAARRWSLLLPFATL